MKNPSVLSSDIALLILAGGSSERMGYPKPWLPFDENTTFLERIIDVYKSAGISDITTVLNHELSSEWWKDEFETINKKSRVILNYDEKKGRMHSLFLGLRNISKKFVFIQNSDNPFIGPEIISALLPHEKDQVVVPVCNGHKGHPVVISRGVRDNLVSKYSEYDSLKTLLNEYEIRLVRIDNEVVLKNLNTPMDFIKAMNELDR